jgi:two-component sensor histidine kinase
MLVDAVQRFRPMWAFPAWWHHVGAVLLVLVAYGLRVALDGIYHRPFLTFIAAILIASVFLDHGAGLLATLLGAALAPRFFVEPGSGLGLGGADAAVALGAFVGFGLFTTGMIEALRTTVDRLREANQRLELAERSARAADEHKGALLVEANHRFKNSLHGIAGMLRAEAARSSDPRVQAALSDAAGRLGVLGRLHERLDVSGEPVASIYMPSFLDALGADLRTLLVGERPIRVSVAAEEVELAAEQAVPVGLVVNEAVTNALKYAFPGGRAGIVSVSLRRVGGGWLRLEVADNGVGLGKDGSPRNGGAGMRLVGALARQLGGEAEWHGPPGTAVVVRIPEPHAD